MVHGTRNNVSAVFNPCSGELITCVVPEQILSSSDALVEDVSADQIKTYVNDFLSKDSGNASYCHTIVKVVVPHSPDVGELYVNCMACLNVDNDQSSNHTAPPLSDFPSRCLPSPSHSPFAQGEQEEKHAPEATEETVVLFYALLIPKKYADDETNAISLENNVRNTTEERDRVKAIQSFPNSLGKFQSPLDAGPSRFFKARDSKSAISASQSSYMTSTTSFPPSASSRTTAGDGGNNSSGVFPTNDAPQQQRSHWKNPVPPLAKSTISLSLAVHLNNNSSILQCLLEHYVAEEGEQLIEGILQEHPFLAQEPDLQPSLLRWYLQWLPEVWQNGLGTRDVHNWAQRRQLYPPSTEEDENSPLTLNELRQFLPFSPNTSARISTTPLTGIDGSRCEQLETLKKYQEEINALSTEHRKKETGVRSPDSIHLFSYFTREDLIQYLIASRDNMALLREMIKGGETATSSSSIDRSRISFTTTSTNTNISRSNPATASDRIDSSPHSAPHRPSAAPSLLDPYSQSGSSNPTAMSQRSKETLVLKAAIIEQLQSELKSVSWFFKVEEAIQQRKTHAEVVLHIVKELTEDPNAFVFQWYNSEGEFMETFKVLLRAVMA